MRSTGEGGAVHWPPARRPMLRGVRGRSAGSGWHLRYHLSVQGSIVLGRLVGPCEILAAELIALLPLLPE